VPSLFTIEPYKQDDQDDWDAFVRASKNGTFLFLRNYMDYHADRFADRSLIIRNSDGVVALLPANQTGSELHSHAGLTYGGLVTSSTMTTPLMKDVFEVLRDYLRQCKISALHYKTVPTIYHRIPAEEDRYALFCANAVLTRRDVLCVIASGRPTPTIQARRKRGAAKAERNGIEVTRSEDWSGYWDVLAAQLEQRYATRPVHSLPEIDVLRQRFPDSIKLYVARKDTEILAGAVIYESDIVAHVQYIASSEKGRTFGALDKLFMDLLTGPYRNKTYFDFGISNEQQGRFLNRGLIEQKEGFGGRAVVHDFYRLEP
jgi:hypothetical protein